MALAISDYSRELTALLVEDDHASRAVLAAQLKRVFKRVLLAGDGAEGLEAFRLERPQIVLTDNQMPVMSGLAMTAGIRQLDPKVPVIFVTGTMDTALLIEAINLGIASFISKPVRTDNLQRALGGVVALLENDHLQRKNVEQELALLQYRDRYHEHQQEQAFRKELSFIKNDYLGRAFTGPAPDRGEWLVQILYAPHDIMCGDSYSLRRLAGGMLVFLADAMGKGLSASLATSVGVFGFNLQVDALDPDRPFDLAAFARGFAALLRKQLLEDEVFPFTLAWLPASGGAVLETASFGMPPILVGRPGSGPIKLRSNNPPWSVYAEGLQVGTHDLGDARSLLLYTDGLNEAETTGGGLYREHLDGDFQASASRDQLWEAFRARVGSPNDDVTLLFLFRVDGPPVWQETRVVAGRLEPVEQLCQELEELLETVPGLEPGARLQFGMAAREALLNAYEHGCLEIPAGRKAEMLEEGTYFQYLMAQEGQADRSIRAELSVLALGGQRLLKLRVLDDGPGFALPTWLFQEPDSLMLSGRGLKMVRTYTDAVHFNERGNAITLFKLFRGTDHAAGPNPSE